MEIQPTLKKMPNFYCEICDFKSSKESNMSNYVYPEYSQIANNISTITKNHIDTQHSLDNVIHNITINCT